MSLSPIQFHCADIQYVLPQKQKVRKWISLICKSYGFGVDQISIVFCSDDYLLQLNRQFLEHDYYTDIITFDNTSKTMVSIEAYISLDRVKENAGSLGTSTLLELHRVIIHGVLHALGFKDKKPAHIKEMRLAEENALLEWNQLKNK